MITIVDAEEAYLKAKSELDELFDQLTYQWYKPQAQIAMGFSAANLRSEQLQGLPQGGVDRIIQFVLGGKNAEKPV